MADDCDTAILTCALTGVLTDPGQHHVPDKSEYAGGYGGSADLRGRLQQLQRPGPLLKTRFSINMFDAEGEK